MKNLRNLYNYRNQPAKVLNETVKTSFESLDSLLQEKVITKPQPLISENEIIKNLQNNVSRYQHLFQSTVHDLKHPIRSILELSRLLEKDISKKEQEELLQIFRDSCSDALEKLNDLLIHEKDENLKFEPVSVNTLLKSCQSSVYGIAAAKQIRPFFTFLKKDLLIKINKPAIKKGLDNIISNAVKFSSAGSKIRISAATQKNKLIISIADKGIGIPEDQQPGIFKKFNKAARQGTNGEVSTGLGLYLAKQSILNHHGRLWFRSAANRETIFFVELDLNILAVDEDSCYSDYYPVNKLPNKKQK